MIAVLLLVFGCPDSPESIEPFIANIMGGRKPSPEQLQKIKERYRMIGGHSPLLDITRRQAEALEKRLNSKIPLNPPLLKGEKSPPKGDFRVFVGIRHWHPFIKDTLKEIVNSGARKIIAVIMTPHYSEFITDGYTKAVNDAKAELLPLSPSFIKGGLGGVDISFVKNWQNHPLFLEAVSDEIRKGLLYFHPADKKEIQVIFSAHSLPINKGQGARDEGRGTRDEGIGEEPYLKQLNETIEGIIKLTGSISWHLGFQSKGMSKGEWLEPTVDSILERLSKEGKKYVLLVPVGFVSDHIETLYDIDIFYKKMAESLGMKFHRTKSLNDSQKFIEALSDIVIKQAALR